MVVRVLIFDLDQTLADEGVLYDGVAELLQKLRTEGYRLFVCSFNAYAEWFLERQGIRQNFEQVLVDLDNEKGAQIARLSLDLDIPLEDMVFFDDDYNNITEARAWDIPSVLVPSGGVKESMVREKL